MNLSYRIVLRVSAAILVLLALWAVMFYKIMIAEINDETDDSLEDFSELIITRALAGEEQPSAVNGTNNSYYINKVSKEYAAQTPWIQYFDEMVYIETKNETEPARILRTIYRDASDNYYELRVLIPTIEKSDLQQTILGWLVFLYVLLLIAIISINGWILYRSFRPLYALLNWLDHYTIGGASAPLCNETKVNEFRKLNEAIMRSTQRNAEAYEQQRIFIGNASHEIQTPLAVCQNRLELLSDDPDLTERQLGEILKTRQTLEYVSKLNKSLLLLTKIENRQVAEATEINVNELIREILDRFDLAVPLRPDVEQSAGLRVKMDVTLAGILFGNLLRNAYMHNIEGGGVSIVISSSTFKITNSGVAEPLDTDNIFKCFYQKGYKSGSSGIGLALVDSICRLYNIAISYRYSEEGRHTFVLDFSSKKK